MLPRLPATEYQSKTENLVVRQGACVGRNAYMAAGRPAHLSLFQAVLRAVVKLTLGLFSRLVMIIARRHRSIHDVLTRSDVVLRDPSIAKVSQYRSERDLALEGQQPSRTRRILLAILYGCFGCIVSTVIFGVSASIACVTIKQCSPFERAESLVLIILAVASSIWLLVLAWRGRLWGSRSTLNAAHIAPSDQIQSRSRQDADSTYH